MICIYQCGVLPDSWSSLPLWDGQLPKALLGSFEGGPVVVQAAAEVEKVVHPLPLQQLVEILALTTSDVIHPRFAGALKQVKDPC